MNDWGVNSAGVFNTQLIKALIYYSLIKDLGLKQRSLKPKKLKLIKVFGEQS